MLQSVASELFRAMPVYSSLGRIYFWTDHIVSNAAFLYPATTVVFYFFARCRLEVSELGGSGALSVDHLFLIDLPPLGRLEIV